MDKLIPAVHSVVAWLDGKKAIILALSSPTISYLVTENIIKPSLGTLLTTLLSILCGGALAVGATQAYKESAPAQLALGARIVNSKP